MSLFKNCLLLSLLVAGVNSASAQEAPAKTAADVIRLKCEVLNPAELSNSTQLGNLSISAFKSVIVAVSPSEGVVMLSMDLSAGRFSLNPRDPRLYSAKIKSVDPKAKEITLKNVDEEESDTVVLNADLSDGKILVYGAELEITCESENI